MIKIAATIAGIGIVGVAGIAVLVNTLGADRSGPAVTLQPIRTAQTAQVDDWLDPAAVRSAAVRKAIENRFAGAPEAILQLATDIANEDVPLANYQDRLAALDAATINAGYGAPHGEEFPQYKHTLLREALITGNTGAGAILVSKGADLGYNDNELPFQAVKLARHLDDFELRFPDYSASSKFLAMWLRAGGDPEITHPLYAEGRGRLVTHVPHNNLEALAYLLAAGADPWSSFDITTDSGAFLYRLPGLFVSLATADRIDSEVAFRLAKLGFYANPPEDGRNRLIAAYEDLAASQPLPKSDNEAATHWAIKRATDAAFTSMGVSAGPKMTAYGRFRPESRAGGFWLSEGQMRSPHAASQRTGNRGAWGPHVWPESTARP